MKRRLLLSVLLSFQVLSLSAQNIDLRLLNYINGPASPADDQWRTVSNSINYVAAAAPVGMLAVGLPSHNRTLTIQGIETGASIVISEATTFVLKKATQRARPYLAHPDLVTGKSVESDYSFPSGHASVAFATATSLSLSFPKWYVIAPSFAYAGLVSYSRLYLGVHYPSDVLAGAVVGAGSSLITWKLQKMLEKRYYPKAYKN